MRARAHEKDQNNRTSASQNITNSYAQIKSAIKYFPLTSIRYCTDVKNGVGTN